MSEQRDLNHAPARSESRLRLTSYFAGDPITLSARLTAGGRSVTGASVKVSTTTPAQSFNNWLAGLKVPPDKLRRAQEILANQDASPILVKQLAAQLAGLQFDPRQHKVTLHLKDPDGTGAKPSGYKGVANAGRLLAAVSRSGA